MQFFTKPTCKEEIEFYFRGENSLQKILLKMETNQNRPTSPHLQIYKWNICSITSIMHRLTGVILYLSIVTISWYIVYYTYQINTLESMEHCDCPMNEIFKQLFLLASIGVTFSLYYHFCNGIRHLFWDLGKGFELKTAQRNGLIVIGSSLTLTALTIGAVIFLKFF